MAHSPSPATARRPPLSSPGSPPSHPAASLPHPPPSPVSHAPGGLVTGVTTPVTPTWLSGSQMTRRTPPSSRRPRQASAPAALPVQHLPQHHQAQPSAHQRPWQTQHVPPHPGDSPPGPPPAPSAGSSPSATQGNPKAAVCCPHALVSAVARFWACDEHTSITYTSRQNANSPFHISPSPSR